MAVRKATEIDSRLKTESTIFLIIDIIGNKREDLSFQRKLESRTKHPFEKLDSCLRRNDKQFISNSRYLGFG
jgi:hypothetical protein